MQCLSDNSETSVVNAMSLLSDNSETPVVNAMY